MTEEQPPIASSGSLSPVPLSPALPCFPEVKPVSRRLIVSSFVVMWMGVVSALAGLVLLMVGGFNESIQERNASWQYDVRVEQNCPAKDGTVAGTAGTEQISGNEKADASTADPHKVTHRRIIQSKKTHHSEISEDWLPFFIGGFSLIVLGMLLPLFYFIVTLVVLYRGWKCIQPLRMIAPEKALTMSSAGGAIGLLFVPFFNLYWIFRASCDVVRYGKELSALYGRRYRGPSSDLAVTLPIIHVSSVILGAISLIAEVIVLYFYTNRLNDMVADLSKVPTGATE